jgi:hypothetical protein
VQVILDLAAGQYALFTGAQWKQAGFSPRALRRKEARRVVEEVHPGVFAIAGAPRSFEQNVLAACLSVGGVASHRCAAYLWGFRKFESADVEVLVRRERTPSRRDVKIRRTAHLEDGDLTVLRGIPITDRPRRAA